MIALSQAARPAKLALIGANGFIGLRTAELLGARADIDLVPIVRSPASLAVLARQPLPWRIAPFLEQDALADALQGCDTCIHAALGDAAQIVRMAGVTYRACAAAGVRRLVWMSSASVHGQDCLRGTDELTPLHDNQPLMYNNAKIHAEWALEKLARDGRVEVVCLRPGVVFGPRSRWIADEAAALRGGRAGWINSGRGICNSIFVDNLVEAIRLAATTPGIGGEAFLVGDAETITWRDFLLPIALHLGLDENAFAELPVPSFAPEVPSRMSALTLTPAYGRLGRMAPAHAKRLVKRLLHAWPEPPVSAGPWTFRSIARKPQPQTQELALLQQCTWKLPHFKAARQIGYAPIVPFTEGMRRSLAWLDFAEGRTPMARP